ncbi:hypothetical protein ACET3Z_012030 [Daucus carota]
MESVMHSELQIRMEILEETLFFQLEYSIQQRMIPPEKLEWTDSDQEREEPYQQDIKKRDQQLKESYKREIKIIEILIRSSDMYDKLQHGVECLQRGMEYMKETEDIQQGMDYTLAGIRYIRIIMRPNICPRYEDQQAMEDIKVYLDQLFKLKRMDLRMSRRHEMEFNEETFATIVDSLPHDDHQEMDYIMEETGDIDGGIKFEESEYYVLHSVNDDQIVSYAEFLQFDRGMQQERKYEDQQGLEDIRDTGGFGAKHVQWQERGSEDWQGMNTIKGWTDQVLIMYSKSEDMNIDKEYNIF